MADGKGKDRFLVYDITSEEDNYLIVGVRGRTWLLAGRGQSICLYEFKNTLNKVAS